MSYVLHGVVLPASAGRVAGEEGWAGDFDLIDPRQGTSLLAFHGRASVGDVVEQAGEEWSRKLGKALVVHWDDRIGERGSSLYESGTLANRLGIADEIHVELDDSGYPKQDGARFTDAEVTGMERRGEDREFETCRNTLALGCDRVAFFTWEQLQEVIQSQK